MANKSDKSTSPSEILKSPLLHPVSSVFVLIVITYLLFFGDIFSVALVFPFVVLILYRNKIRFLNLCLFLAVILLAFFSINYVLTEDITLALKVGIDQGTRWYLLMIIGFYFQFFISTASIIYIFDKIKTHNLSIPLLVAFKILPKIKNDIVVGNRAATVRGLRSGGASGTFRRLNSVIFMVMSTMVIFLLEFSVPLRLRGVQFGEKVIYNRFKFETFSAFITIYFGIALVCNFIHQG